MNNHTSSLEFSHFPVMLNEVIKISSPLKGGMYIDCTFGGGGYSKHLLKFPTVKVKGLDRDSKVKILGKNLEKKFKESEFFYLLVYRIIGGIPFVLSNVLPCIFNVKISNFFWATLIGISPQFFLVVSIGSGLEKIIEQNLEAPNTLDLIYSPEIYIPMLAFVALLILTFIGKKIFYKK